MSLRARILSLVLLVNAGAGGILRWCLPMIAKVDRRSAKGLQSAAGLIAADLHDAVRSTAQLEYGLARARATSDTVDRAACSAFLASVLKEHPQYRRPPHHPPRRPAFLRFVAHRPDLQLTDRRFFQQMLDPRASWLWNRRLADSPERPSCRSPIRRARTAALKFAARLAGPR